ncbi:ABC transporter substrate-binding protein [Paenibacillus psychroresistens]|nr:sugar ABC transporter substrate-binding protein [Paenibacillus psychroresistens]
MKKSLFTVILFTMIFSLSACNEPMKAKEPATIHLLLPKPNGYDSGGYLRDDLFKKAVPAFQKINPLITVVIDYITGEENYETDPLDVIPYNTLLINEVQKEEIFLDLKPLQQKADNKELDINKNILDLATSNGKLLIIPSSANPLVILYNKDLYKKAGIPFPQGNWTWEQFREVSKKIKDNHGSVIPYDPYIMELLMSSTGKSLISPDADTSIGYLDSPEAIRSIQWLNDYYKDDESKTVPLNFTDAYIRFSTEQVAMILGSIDSYTLLKQKIGDKIGAAPLPYFEGGMRANPISFDGYGISKNSKHPEESWAFIQYLTLTNHENAISFSNFNITTSASVAKGIHQDTDPIKSVIADELNYAVLPSGFRSPLYSNPKINNQFQELFNLDDKELPEKLHELALSADEELKRVVKGD